MPTGARRSEDRQEALEQLASNIRRHRRWLEISQEQLAWEAAINRTQLSLHENGRREVGALTLLKLAVPLHLSVDDLLDGIAWQPPGPGHKGRFIGARAATKISRHADLGAATD
jgi:DNA-binding XRE family transcriptional regulator